MNNSIKNQKRKLKIVIPTLAISAAFAGAVRDLYTDYQALSQFYGRVEQAKAFLKPGKNSVVDSGCKKLPLNFLELQLSTIDAIDFADDADAPRKKRLLAFEMATRAKDYNQFIDTKVPTLPETPRVGHGGPAVAAGNTPISGKSYGTDANTPLFYKVSRGDVANYGAVRDPNLDARINQKDFKTVVNYFNWDGANVYKESSLLALNIGMKKNGGGYSNTLHGAALNADISYVSGAGSYIDSVYQYEELGSTDDPMGPKAANIKQKAERVTDKAQAQLGDEVAHLKQISGDIEQLANYCASGLIYLQQEDIKNEEGVSKKTKPYELITKEVAKSVNALELKTPKEYSEMNDKRKAKYKAQLERVISHCPKLSEKLFATYNTLNKFHEFKVKADKAEKGGTAEPPLLGDTKNLPCYEAFLARIEGKK